MKGKEKMKEIIKTNLGNFAIYIGKHAVGKCLSPGMFEPKIPDIFKEDSKGKIKVNSFQDSKGIVEENF